jgi:5-(carboxyamino)imidazole ribonucleotide synthase
MIPSPIPPGATLGILGSGQLGRMLAMAARSLGYRIGVYSPEANSPAGVIADFETVGAYEDAAAVAAFARRVDVLTFEFENVPAASTRAIGDAVPIRPSGEVLHVTQNRLREKGFLQSRGFPVTPFRKVECWEDLRDAVTALGVPGVLKTADFGYDGKGQVKILAAAETEAAWKTMRGAPAIYEAFVSFEKELSVVAARTAAGDFAAYPVFENAHANHILDVTIAPAEVDPAVGREAVELARGILDELEVVGLLTVELFLTTGGKVLVNELAPRTHNSGHLTIDACVTSQFEQQVRAVCGLPLGSTELREPAAMANLLGHLWSDGPPDWSAALSDPGVKLHLYGKTEPRPGRKMGHLTVAAPTPREAAERVRRARGRLRGGENSRG